MDKALAPAVGTKCIPGLIPQLYEFVITSFLHNWLKPFVPQTAMLDFEKVPFPLSDPLL
jgi:hypothetical protein